MSQDSDAPPTAVVVPIRSFEGALSRLADVIGQTRCNALMRTLAGVVVAAADGYPVHVPTDDIDVARWCQQVGATAVLIGRPGLSHAVATTVERLAAAGTDRAVVAHADLPLATSLNPAVGRGLTIVPDRRRDGSNVICVPTRAGFRFSYGPGSFGRHVAEAQRVGLDVTVVDEPSLAHDIDNVDDLLDLPAPHRSRLHLDSALQEIVNGASRSPAQTIGQPGGSQ